MVKHSVESEGRIRNAGRVQMEFARLRSEREYRKIVYALLKIPEENTGAKIYN